MAGSEVEDRAQWVGNSQHLGGLAALGREIAGVFPVSGV